MNHPLALDGLAMWCASFGGWMSYGSLMGQVIAEHFPPGCPQPEPPTPGAVLERTLDLVPLSAAPSQLN